MANRRRTIKEDGPDPIDQYVGARLRARRKSLGLSQTKLSHAVGVTFQQVQKYENGMNRIGGGNLYKMSKALSVGVDFFFEGIPENPSKIGKATIHEDNAMASPEAVRFASDVTRIPDPAIRKSILHLLKGMAQGGN